MNKDKIQTSNEILITTCTHGDEEFAVPVVESLAKKYQFDWQINNQKAYEGNVRYIDADLNRSGPGNDKSDKLEERLAYKIIKKASKYKQIIDIHGTKAATGNFIILSDPNWQNIEFAKKLNIKNVVLWPSMKPNGPLTQFIPNSLEIECGPKNDIETAKKLSETLEDFLKGKKTEVVQDYFIVSGYLKGKVDKSMKEFTKTTVNGDSFYPLMVDQYQKRQGIKCYCMKKLQNTLEF